jgi:adenosylcobinamide-GDP ribazoletransferase
MSSLAALADWWTDLRVGLIFLTRLPLRQDGSVAAGELSRATRVYPVVGVAIGAAGGAAFWLAAGIGLPPLLAGLIAVAVTMLLTGALHEDGLADTADGLGGGGDRARKLEIMADSRTGSYGVAALILSIALRGAALGALAAPAAVAGALIAAHAVSRACLPAAMAAMPLARGTGLAAATGRPQASWAWTALALAAVIVLPIQGLSTGSAALAAGALAAGFVAWLARVQIGGYTGDVLGALQQAAETAVLLSVVAWS